MTTQDIPVLSPAAEPKPVETPPAGTTITAPVAEVKVEVAADKKSEAEKTADEKTPPWFQKRIDELTAEKYDLRKKLEAKTPEKAAPGDDKPAAAPEERDISKLIEQRASQIVEQKLFDESCNRIYENGKRDIPTFETSMSTLGRVADLESFRNFLGVAVELPAAAKVLDHLGKNPEEAKRIISAAPHKMALELARLEASLANTAAPVSSAPAPIKPVGGAVNAAADLTNPNLSTEEWIELRDKQKATRKRGYY